MKSLENICYFLFKLQFGNYFVIFFLIIKIHITHGFQLSMFFAILLMSLAVNMFFCRAVKIADFANYVQKLHADSNLLFSSEYKVIFYINQRHTFFSNNCFITLRLLMVMQHMDAKKVIRKLHP